MFRNKSDLVGALASALCMIHCMATPFLFIAHSSAVHCCDTSPWWWKLIDYVFLVISFLMVRSSVRKAVAGSWIKPALWITWLSLALVLLNEETFQFELPSQTIYYPAFGLVVLHLYNLYGVRRENKCCGTCAKT